MRTTLAVLSAVPLLLAGCHSTPDVMPLQWFVGSTTVDPAGVAVFGPSGETAISWEVEREQGSWVWNESRPHDWNSRTAWMQHGNGFIAAIGTGAWEGNIKVYADQWGDDLYQPEAWDYELLLSDGSGVINGRGQVTAMNLFIDQRWIRPDGTVVATMKQQFAVADEETYRRAVARNGGVARP